MQLHTAGLVVLKERKLLLAFSNNKQAFYLPGGKVNNGEETLNALCREIEEELNIILQKEELKYYTHISAPAYGERNGIIMEQECFLYSLKETPLASAEIGALGYFDEASYLQQAALVPGVLMIMKQLKKDGLLD